MCQLICSQRQADDLLPVTVHSSSGYVNAQGEMVIQPRFTRAGDFSEGLAAVYVFLPDYMFPAAGFINTSGQWVIQPSFDGAGSFHEGFARVTLRDTRGSKAFVFRTGDIMSVPNGDHNGMVLGDFSEGLAVWSPDGANFGFVDQHGNASMRRSKKSRPTWRFFHIYFFHRG